MNPAAIPWAVLAGVAVGAFVHSLFRPWKPLAPRVRPYTARSTDRAQMLALLSPAPEGSAVRRVFGPMVAAVVKRVSQLAGHQNESEVALALDRAGIRDVTPLAYTYQQGAYAVAGMGAGILAGVMAGPRMGLIAAVLGGVWGVTVKRSELERRTRKRTEAIRSELLSICQILAIYARATPNLQGVVAQVVVRIKGEVAGELSRVLEAIESGTPPEIAFEHAARLTPEPAAARLYRTLANAVTTGGDIAGALLAQAADVREALRDGRRAAASRRRMVMVMTTVVFMLPPMVLYIAAPIPSLVLSNR